MIQKILILKNLVTLYYKSKRSIYKNNEVTFKLHGFTIHSYGYTTLILLYREIFLRQIYKFETTNNTPLIIDCGANIGMSVLFFKMLYPNSEIWAFEANPFAIELLKKNINSNNLSGVIVYECALSDSNGFIDFLQPHQKGSLNGSIYNLNIDSKVIKVESKRLSDFIDHKKVDFVKIDIEGAENLVVKDLFECKKLNLIKELIIEHHLNENQGICLEQFLKYFIDSNFECDYNLSEINSPNSIVHFKSLES